MKVYKLKRKVKDIRNVRGKKASGILADASVGPTTSASSKSGLSAKKN